MSNENNLKPVRTKEEARKRGRNGGIKSGKVRAERKTLKEELLLLLSTTENNKTLQEKISLSLIQEALIGNVRAYESIRDTIGEKPKDKIEIDNDKPFEVNINVVNQIKKDK